MADSNQQIVYPQFQNVNVLTGRNFGVAFNGIQKIGYLQDITITDGRTISPRYELGMDEISYLAPGPHTAGKNTVTVNKFLVFTQYDSLLDHAMYDGYSNDPRKDSSGSDKPSIISLLDFYTPFDILVFLQDQVYMTLKECWMDGRTIAIKTDAGNYGPVLEQVTIQYTYMTP